MSYKNSFAKVYDIFTESVNYSQRADYIGKLLQRHCISGGTILDVACGTGNMTEQFLKKGFEVVATDLSYEMLSIAREKLSEYNDKILLLCQDMRELDLFGTVDAAICSLDSVNHLTGSEDIKKAFESISKFIVPGGLFIFDVNTIYKHKEVLSDKTFVYEDETSFLIWQNSECDDDNIIEMYIDIFSEDDDGKYFRDSDFVVERAYSIEYLLSVLKDCKFYNIEIFGDLTFDSPKNNDERIYFVAKKK